MGERKRCFRSLLALHVRVSVWSPVKNSLSALAIPLWSWSGSTNTSRSFWVVFWFCQRFECTHEWNKTENGGFLPTKILQVPKMSLQPTNITDTKPWKCYYLCKMEHLEKPRAGYLNHSAEGWARKRKGWDSGHQHKGGPGPKSVWSFLYGRKIRFVRAVSSVWSLLRDISSPRLRSILRIPNCCLAEGKCGSNRPVLFHQSWVKSILATDWIAGEIWRDPLHLRGEHRSNSGKWKNSHRLYWALDLGLKNNIFFFRCSHCPLNGLFQFLFKAQ